MSSLNSAAEQRSLAAQNPQLAVALAGLTKTRLHDVVSSLAASDRTIEAALEKALLVADVPSPDVPSRKRKSSAPHPKRPAKPRYLVCQQCEADFDVTKNNPEACRWHPGECEPDYESDFWADHDENCHGIISTLRDEYPEGFIYDCCEEDGTSKGCEVGRHEAKSREGR